MNLHSTLVDLIGARHVVVDPAEIAPYLSDHRQRFVGRAAAVVRPATTGEVAGVVRACAAAGAPVVPFGGNTSLCGGATADDPRAVVIDLRRMHAVRSIDPVGRTIVVDAGCTVGAVRDAARAAGCSLALSFGAEGSATIGGAVSTNAGGVNVVRYGMVRRQVLGVEVVLADGRVLDDLRTLHKDNTGYALSQLFVGAEGTLGVVTAVALHLNGPVAERVVALLDVPDLPAALAVLGTVRSASDDRLTSFEVADRAALDLVERHCPEVAVPLAPRSWAVLVELSSARTRSDVADVLERALGVCAAEGTVDDAIVAPSEHAAAELWRLRDAVPEAERRAGGSIKHDVSVPLPAVPDLVDRCRREVQRVAPGASTVVFGHLGDGNAHLNVVGVPPEGESAVTQAVLEVVHDLHGSFSAEHGIGRSKREALLRYRDPVALEVMITLKHALDPTGIMNPGVMLPGPNPPAGAGTARRVSGEPAGAQPSR